LSLSEHEIEILGGLSLDDGVISSVIQDSLDNAADSFRAAWSAKGLELDPREHYISTGYKEFILAFARWNMWCRFPLSETYALSEPRKLQYEKALDLLKNPWLDVDKVDWTDPELEPYLGEKKGIGSSILVPGRIFIHQGGWTNSTLA